MMKFEMTYHAKEDRLDRLAACIEHLGVGEVILEVERFGAMERLTSTGIVLIVNAETNTLITGYAATIKQMYGMYKTCGYERVPDRIYKQVVRNSKKYAFLYKMQKIGVDKLNLLWYN